MAATGRGIRKINERVIENGRTLVITTQDADKYNWSEIPNGSIMINPNDGTIYHKEAGQTNWVPSGVKNDGTISIARDSIIREEKFTITDINDDEFTYTNKDDIRKIGQYTDDGFMVFELPYEYQIGRNLLEIYIDTVLRRTAYDEQIREIDSKRFAVLEQLEINQQVTVQYVQVNRIGNPYPRIYATPNQPASAEEGDIWITDDINLETNSSTTTTKKDTVSWSQITNTPTSLSGYGINDNVAYKGHTHTASEISGLSSLPANGGNADTVAHRSPGYNPGDLAIIGTNGKLPQSIIPDSSPKTLTISFPDGSSSIYNSLANVNTQITTEKLGIFDSSGKLVFPNGNKLWIG